ncbi:MAG TPA: hypothetical protein DCQ31_11380 [Bacteroidales bacterium]|nr:hypothetical protein [Bacteroidales bacterium]
MKNNFYLLSFKKIAIIMVIFSTLTGCSLFRNYSRISILEDLANASRITKYEAIYFDINKRSPLILLNQSIVKNTKANKLTNYKLFHTLTLTENSFVVNDSAYLIIDKEVFTLIPERKELDSKREVSVDKNTILTSDSTKIDVVSGYNVSTRNLVRYIYNLKPEQVNKLKEAKTINFQYYAGPHIIVAKVRPLQAKKMKRFFETF